ncbi:MAG: hypothetical protein EX269_03345 [Acidimicrobiales bacterium]|nr:MAG: hypothetical protein EX269_03345 [Acidimicrobiales bacterium]
MPSSSLDQWSGDGSSDHNDTDGNEAANLDLSQRRAESVKSVR